MENKVSLRFLSLCLYPSTVAAGYGRPSDKWALGGLRICWRTAGFPVFTVWSSQATLGLQATTSPLIMVPVCARSGGTCHPVMTVCSPSSPIPCHHLCISSALNSSWTLVTDSLPAAHSVPLSSLAYHTCCCHLFRYLANISPTAFGAGHAPSGEKGFFFSNQWLLLDSDTTKQWHLGNIMSSVLEMVYYSYYCQDIQPLGSEVCGVWCVVFTALRTLPFPGFLRTASSTEIKSVHSNDSIKLVFKVFNFYVKF